MSNTPVLETNDRIYPNAIPLAVDPFYRPEYSPLRRIKAMLFAEQLGKSEDFRKLTFNKQTQILTAIENSCINESIRKGKEYNVRCIWSNELFENIYHGVCYTIISTLDNDINSYSDILLKKILDDKFDILNIAHMSCKELCPEKYEDIDKQLTQRRGAEQTLKYSEMYHCRKCKKNQCVTEKRYNRSLDEGVNLTVNCLFCGNSWNA